MAAAYERAAAYEIHREATDIPGQDAYRFHVRAPAPVELLTTIGDALHNMRSCLDSVAYKLARRHLGDQMTSRQQAATQFPISKDRADFDGVLRCLTLEWS